MCFIAETIKLYVKEFRDIIKNSETIQTKLLYYIQAGLKIYDDNLKINQSNHENRVILHSTCKSIKETNILILKKGQNGVEEEIDFHKHLNINANQEFDEIKFAKLLHKIDISFLKSLRVSDFFREPIFLFHVIQKLIYHNFQKIFKIRKYQEYINTLKQMLKIYVLNNNILMDPD